MQWVKSRQIRDHDSSARVPDQRYVGSCSQAYLPSLESTLRKVMQADSSSWEPSLRDRLSARESGLVRSGSKGPTEIVKLLPQRLNSITRVATLWQDIPAADEIG